MNLQPTSLKIQKLEKCNNCDRLKRTKKWTSHNVKRFEILSDNQVTHIEGTNFYTKHFGKLRPGFSIHFEKYYLYWFDERAENLNFCSSNCSKEYSKKTGCILITLYNEYLEGTIMIVTPHEDIFEQYCQSKGIMRSIGYENRKIYYTRDLDYLLSAPDHDPEQVMWLAHKYIDEGNHELPLRIANYTLEELSNKKALSAAAILFWRLNKIDKVYEIFNKLGPSSSWIEKSSSEEISSWAFLLVQKFPEKSRWLSNKALEKDPDNYIVIENHIAILAANDMHKEALNFIEINLASIFTVTGYFNVAEIYRRYQLYNEAIEYFQASYYIHPDIVILKQLIETCFLVEEFNMCRIYIGFAKMILDNSHSEKYIESDQINSFYLDVSPEIKSRALKSILYIEGRVKIIDGDEIIGKEILSKANKIKIEGNCDHEMFNDLPYYIHNFMSQEILLIENKILIDQNNSIQSELNSIQFKIQGLNDLLNEISSVYKEWGNSIVEVKNEIMENQLDEYFSKKLHALAIHLKSYDQKDYLNSLDHNKTIFCNLSKNVLISYTNAYYFYHTLKRKFDSSIAIFAAVITEMTKAIELTINEQLIKKFSKYLIDTQKSTTINLSYGKYFAKLYLATKSSIPKNIMLYDIIWLLKSDNQDWLSFVKNYLQDDQSWITDILPKILNEIRVKFRNGLVHYSSAIESQATQFMQYIDQTALFSKLNNI